MMKTKKGFLLGEYTLKIIIAVISLLLLFYLLFMIYSSSQDNKQLKMAEASLNDLVEGMDRAKEIGEDVEVIILNPVKESFIGKGWNVIAWPYGNEEEKPQSCIGNCICICSMPKISTQGGSLKQCDSLGICENFDEKIKTFNGAGMNVPIVIKNPPVGVQVKYGNEGFEIRQN